MPKEPPLYCDCIEEWYDTDRKIRIAYTMAIKSLEDDVIDRAKIDKSIEEIEEQRYIHYTNVSDVIDSVLEILKRNIGDNK
jgi:hypothetical protein